MDKAAKKTVDPEQPTSKKLKKSDVKKPTATVPLPPIVAGVPTGIGSPTPPKAKPAATTTVTTTKPTEEGDTFKDAIQLRDKLQAEWKKGDTGCNMQVVAKYLDDVKLILVKLKFLESSGHDIPTGEEALARDILEMGVMYSIFKEEPDMELFTSYMSQLKTYYYDYGKRIAASSRKYEILGSYLLYLLSREDLGEFHLEVARILYPIESSPEIMQNVFIKRATDLERALEEGRFSQIHAEDGPQMQSRLWRYFVQNLTMSTRDKIAETIEAAYDKLSARAAMDRLKLKDQSELTEFAAKRKWTFKDGNYLFTHADTENDSVPAKRLVKDFLGYASELEVII